MSTLSQYAEDYLQLRRTFGHKMRHADRLLPRFVTYLEAIGAETVTVETTLAWAQSAGHLSVRAQCMAVVRGYARFLVGIDPRTEVPPIGLLPYPNRRRPPFIYSPDDIAALMAAARKTLEGPLRATTYETLIGLLAVTGMRVGEVINLNRADVDLAEGVLTVRMTKFCKSREVPLHRTTVEALVLYARKRDELQRRPSASFFIYDSGKPMQYPQVQRTFRRIVNSAGVGAGSPLSPHIHDLRHSFAVRTLIDWYRKGENVEACLPRLSTYLGHIDPHATYWYLSAVPELLALAAKRLESTQEVYRV
ncbi:MAG TPA: tyrosine-type recombinase/integrase [Spirochaetia bacterium]|nr:tyrosine-type recombinase/integrase [Spirochaetia bacterium]